MVLLGVGGGQARGEERKSEQRKSWWGMGRSFGLGGEEARRGGVLTVVEEALRCSERNFFFHRYPPTSNWPIPPHPANPRS